MYRESAHFWHSTSFIKCCVFFFFLFWFTPKVCSIRGVHWIAFVHKEKAQSKRWIIRLRFWVMQTMRIHVNSCDRDRANHISVTFYKVYSLDLWVLSKQFACANRLLSIADFWQSNEIPKKVCYDRKKVKSIQNELCNSVTIWMCVAW